jgi:hypothetical protein
MHRRASPMFTCATIHCSLLLSLVIEWSFSCEYVTSCPRLFSHGPSMTLIFNDNWSTQDWTRIPLGGASRRPNRGRCGACGWHTAGGAQQVTWGILGSTLGDPHRVAVSLRKFMDIQKDFPCFILFHPVSLSERNIMKHLWWFWMISIGSPCVWWEASEGLPLAHDVDAVWCCNSKAAIKNTLGIWVCPGLEWHRWETMGNPVLKMIGFPASNCSTFRRVFTPKKDGNPEGATSNPWENHQLKKNMFFPAHHWNGDPQVQGIHCGFGHHCWSLGRGNAGSDKGGLRLDWLQDLKKAGLLSWKLMEVVTFCNLRTCAS